MGARLLLSFDPLQPRRERRRRVGVLFVGNLFHPVDSLAVERFLDGDVLHRGVRGGAMPVLLARREADDVSGSDLGDRTTIALGKSSPEDDDQRLAEGMGNSSTPTCSGMIAPGQVPLSCGHSKDSGEKQPWSSPFAWK